MKINVLHSVYHHAFPWRPGVLSLSRFKYLSLRIDHTEFKCAVVPGVLDKGLAVCIVYEGVQSFLCPFVS